MNTIKKTSYRKNIFTTLSFTLLFTLTLTVNLFAAPQYQAGETLDPSCLPTDGTCTVSPVSLGDTLPNTTAGSVLFVGTAGILAQDNASLFFDDTNNRLGVGTDTPDALLSVSGEGSITETGPELITNGSFDTDPSLDGWTLGDCVSYTSGTLVAYIDGVCGDASIALPFFEIVDGTSYVITFTVSGVLSGESVYYYGDYSPQVENITNGTHSFTFTADETNQNYITIDDENYNTGGGYTIDNFSVKEIEEYTPDLFSVKDIDGSEIFKLTTGINSFGLGRGALQENTIDGTNNIAIGYGSMNLNVNGSDNIALGYLSLRASINSFGNIALGKKALSETTNGSSNIAIGQNTMDVNTTGYSNIAIGDNSLGGNIDGAYNIAFGLGALDSNTSGTYNYAIGGSALDYNTTGTYNIGIGHNVLNFNKTGSYNTALGYRAGYGSINNSNYTGNALFGYQAGYLLRTNGDYNTLLGYQAGDNITTGAQNIIIGYGVDATSATASSQLNIGNTIYGDLSTDSIGIGASTISAKLHVTGTTEQLRLGYDASIYSSIQVESDGGTSIRADGGTAPYLYLYSINNASNTDAVFQLGESVLGDESVFLQAYNNISGENTQLVMSDYAASLIWQDGLGGIDSNLTIGSNIEMTIGGGNQFTVTGDYSTSSGAVAMFITDGNAADDNGIEIWAGQDTGGTGNLIQFRDGDGTDVGEITFSGTTTTYGTSSDERLKDNIIDTTRTLDDLLSIQVRDFTFNTEDTGRIYTGFIAQEIYEIYPDAVYAPEHDFWSVDYGKITPLIVKGIQEMNLTITGIKDITDQTFKDKLIQWFGDATNGIQTMFAKKVQTDELCVGTVCVTESQFLEMLNQNGTSYNTSSPQEEAIEDTPPGGEEVTTDTETTGDAVGETTTEEETVTEEEVVPEATEEVVTEEPTTDTPEEPTPVEEAPVE